LLTEIILLSFCGGLFCLDRIFLQIMISRPIVVAPFIGLLLNDPYAGLIIGAVVELFWIDRIPVGTYIPPNDTVAAVLATSFAVLTGQNLGGGTSPQLIALAVIIALPFGVVAGEIDIIIIKSNDVLSDKALLDAEKTNIKGIERKNYLGLIKVFSLMALYLMLVQNVLLKIIIRIYPVLPSPVVNTLSLLYYFLPILGIAVAVNSIKLRGAVPVFCVILLITAVVLEFFHVF